MVFAAFVGWVFWVYAYGDRLVHFNSRGRSVGQIWLTESSACMNFVLRDRRIAWAPWTGWWAQSDIAHRSAGYKSFGRALSIRYSTIDLICERTT